MCTHVFVDIHPQQPLALPSPACLPTYQRRRRVGLRWELSMGSLQAGSLSHIGFRHPTSGSTVAVLMVSQGAVPWVGVKIASGDLGYHKIRGKRVFPSSSSREARLLCTPSAHDHAHYKLVGEAWKAWCSSFLSPFPLPILSFHEISLFFFFF